MLLASRIRKISSIPSLTCRYNYSKLTTLDLFSNEAISRSLKSKSITSLFREWFVYQMISYDVITNNADVILRWTRKLLGEKAAHWLLKKTIYKQFVAGEEKYEVLERIKKLEKQNIKVFLSYASEQTDKNSEAEFENLKKHIMDCIRIVVDFSENDRITAIKISQLTSLYLQKKINSIIRYKHRRFIQLSGQSNVDLNAITLQTFGQNIQTIEPSLTDASIESMFQQVSSNKDKITARRWQDNLVKGTDLYELLKRKSTDFEELTRGESTILSEFIRRIDEIGNMCEANNVKLLVDAEQTYIQNFIHQTAVHYLMKKFNTSKCIVYNTYQCVLRNTENELNLDLKYAKEENFIYGLKMVRGAYLLEERRVAREMGYPDPTNPTIESTTDMYNRVMDICLREVQRDKMRLMVATHNRDSITRATQLMEQLGIPKEGGVLFGQVLGICDYVSYSLAQAGYVIYKAVPYGPVMEVIPYLIRRAQENRSLMKGADFERKLLGREITNRLKYSK